METFQEYIKGLIVLGANHNEIMNGLVVAFPNYVDEVLIPSMVHKVMTGSPDKESIPSLESESIGAWHHSIQPSDPAPVPSDRVVRLKDVEKIIGNMTTIMNGIRAASFVPHDGAPTFPGPEKERSGADQIKTTQETMKKVGGTVEEVAIGFRQAAGFKPDPVIQNNSTTRRDDK